CSARVTRLALLSERRANRVLMLISRTSISASATASCRAIRERGGVILASQGLTRDGRPVELGMIGTRSSGDRGCGRIPEQRGRSIEVRRMAIISYQKAITAPTRPAATASPRFRPAGNHAAAAGAPVRDGRAAI